MGYHLAKIQKGEYGFSSKLREEVEELQDAEAQQNRLMALIELADLVGAIDGYLKRQFPSFSIDDLRKMADATHSAFMDGTRK
jgi:hypothetical protein